jgi:hypothetical protein
MRSSYLIAGLVLAAAVILGLTYYLRQAPESSEPVVATPAQDEGLTGTGELAPESVTPGLDVMDETPPSPVINEPVLVLPPLDGSDAFVRERLPETLPEAWLEKEDLIRRLAVVLENASRGEIPKRQLAFMAPDSPYPVQEIPVEGRERPRYLADPAGYTRYDRYLDMLEALPAGDLALLIVDTGPLLSEAMAELGSQAPVTGSILEAVDEILAVPVLEGDVELVQPKVLFEYADPDLEALTGLQKQVLRMGPRNVERLQAYLRVLRADLVD